MPQAASAHDTFWDFVSLMPESTHMLMWVMSDRALPRSFRTMQGFGVHTFRLVNAKGESRFVKFHWTPVAGTHSLDWDESVKIAGADPDYTRRDLWESIEAGVFPEYELGFQIFTEDQANEFSFDVLDATKIVPEELVPVTPVGRMVLNRNPDNFFAETEQVAFGVQNLVPGIDFSNDPLLAGRIHSYFDTQLLRLGGPNFHEIPINAPIAQAHNNQRDGFHRQAIHRGRVAYEPNSLGGGCPFQAGLRGFTTLSRADRRRQGRGKAREVRRPLLAGDAVLEQPDGLREGAHHPWLPLRAHEGAGARDPRAHGLHAAQRLGRARAGGGRRPGHSPAPSRCRGVDRAAAPRSHDLAGPVPDLSARRRQHPGAQDRDSRRARCRRGLGHPNAGGACPRPARWCGCSRRGSARVEAANGETLDPDATFETMPSVLFDAVVVPDGRGAADQLSALGHAREFLKDQYRHCKPILMLGAGRRVVEAAGVPTGDGSDWALVRDLPAFVEAIGRHRNWDRATDPPGV